MWKTTIENDDGLKNTQCLFFVNLLHQTVFEHLDYLPIDNFHVRGWEKSKIQREWITPAAAPLQRSYARSCSLLPEISKCYISETTNLSQLNGHECRASVKICLVCKKQTFHNGIAKQGKRMSFIWLNFHTQSKEIQSIRTCFNIRKTD